MARATDFAGVPRSIPALASRVPEIRVRSSGSAARTTEREIAERRIGAYVAWSSYDIDLMKPRDLYRQTFKNAREVTEGKETYRVPSLEMALAMKFAAMVSPNRQQVKKFQDAHDFGQILLSNPELNRETLQTLCETIFGGGGAEVLEIIRKMQAGEKIEL